MRADIQVLRGYAVASVLLYHAKLELWSGGYLGVDVFFVISGFLVTRMVVADIQRHNFSFRQFYFRRAKRLLPAAYSTFLVTLLAAPFLLTSVQFADFKWQLIGAFGFFANYVLLFQADYFGGTAGLKPLLHIWSLSIEEQFYFILPWLLVFAPERYRKPLGVTLVLGSLGFCIFVMTRQPSIAFYSLPTRAWELGVGSVGALVVVGPKLMRWLRYTFYPAIGGLLLLPLFSWGIHPGPAALAACLCTLVVILRGNAEFFRATIITTALARLGDLSYSLYLVHWPLFAFAANIWIGDFEKEIPLPIRVTLIAASLALGWLQYHLVEEPCRHADWKMSTAWMIKAAATAAVMIAMTSAIAAALAPAVSYIAAFRPTVGFSDVCRSGKLFNAPADCRNSEHPTMMVWGDSFAMHLVPGIAADAQVLQATRSMCGPFLGLALVDNGRPRREALSCMAFNDSVMAYLNADSTIDTVVLSSPLTYLLAPEGKVLIRDANGHVASTPASPAILLRSLRATAQAIRASGKRVILVAPPPTGGFDIARCIERRDTGKILLGTHDECDIPVNSRLREQKSAMDFLDEATAIGVPVFDASKALCDDRVCKVTLDGVFLYRDDAHLSYDGSVALARSLRLVPFIRKNAQ